MGEEWGVRWGAGVRELLGHDAAREAERISAGLDPRGCGTNFSDVD